MDTTVVAAMNDTRQGETELAGLIVESLNLEGVVPADILPEAPLFGAGLGLDSLDMLELSMTIEQKYGVKLRSDDPDNEKIFGSLRSLAGHIHQHRAS
jgi:acyl carrier protein